MSSFWFMISTVFFLLSGIFAVMGIMGHKTEIIFISIVLGILSITSALFTRILQQEKSTNK